MREWRLFDYFSQELDRRFPLCMIHSRTMANRRGYSLNSWWTNEIAIDPSPTAEATRLTLPPRTSPAAKTPGRLVSSK